MRTGRRRLARPAHGSTSEIRPPKREDRVKCTPQTGCSDPLPPPPRPRRETPLVLVPSVYVWPHVRVNCDDGWPLALIYRAPFFFEHLRHSSPPELVRGLRALGDPTRLRIVQLVAHRPRSAQKLAPLLRLTEAGASKHLRMLADAGLLASRREGYYVLYSLTFERLEQLASELRHLVALDEDDPDRADARRGEE
jgi:DNA-binding transcriptional ArsR family regulator